ncbi:30S ribosomal protein S16 [Candidatus Shapirobacteria bacterium CG09_land_8_20_14_0_10_38_17]|uniref:Small ribosomal subunit protein bS16 n=1 Tax=Candidatus Shapirobacteria bacterium CG09_land_8_20_14_0_10_38_17 TaxID=1974884 RepID=A0A2H0WRY3_9BACT|nr:MAG: 30S ribosomal protein S16 [Candidatus Shapirobacteria bacterium CG09_land_8_20_14_0_10_38_17]
MLKIRLSQVGKKNHHAYRVVIAEARSKRDGKTIDRIGYYNPRLQPPELKIKKDRLNYWLNHGAQMSDQVRKLIKTALI